MTPSPPIRTAALTATLLVGLLPAAAAWAQFDPADGPPISRVASEDFEPPELGEGLDWIRLKSGEWLKGDIDGMRSRKLQFDSDELDDQSFDFEDVSAIVTSRPLTLVFPNRVVVTGPVAMRGQVIRMRIGDAVRTFARSELIGIVPGTPREANYWSGDFSLGLTARSGNTDQTEVTGLAEIKREDALTRGTLKYNGAFGKLDGTTNVNNHRATGKLDYFLWRRTYLIPVWIEGYKDELQNINWRVTPAAGVGHTLVDEPRLDWEIEAAVGYQYVEYDQAPPGQGRFEGDAAGIFGTSWESDITSSLEFDGEYRLQQSLDRLKDTTHHTLLVLSQDLVWNLDLDVSFVWDRTETPRQENDGTRPERNDFRLTVGFGWDF